VLVVVSSCLVLEKNVVVLEPVSVLQSTQLMHEMGDLPIKTPVEGRTALFGAEVRWNDTV
jgi:hypothetical protein